jgi:glycosidase
MVNSIPILYYGQEQGVDGSGDPVRPWFDCRMGFTQRRLVQPWSPLDNRISADCRIQSDRNVEQGL